MSVACCWGGARGGMMAFFFLCRSRQFRTDEEPFPDGRAKVGNRIGLGCTLKITLLAVLIAGWYSQTFWTLLNLMTQHSPLRYIMDRWSLSPLFMGEMLHDITATRRYSRCSLSCPPIERYRRKTRPDEPLHSSNQPDHQEPEDQLSEISH